MINHKNRMLMVNIDYHSNDLRAQIVTVMGDSIMNDVLETTIRFVTEMIRIEINQVGINVSVSIFQEQKETKLVFTYQCIEYSPILNVGGKSNHIDDFFDYYFDDIHHEYTNGNNKLIFRFTMMSNEDMQKKFFDALDRKKTR